MDETKELKPCPHCGAKAVLVRHDAEHYYVYCEGFPSHGLLGRGHEQYRLYSHDMAIAEWNNRPIEDALRAENERQYAGLTDQVNRLTAKLQAAEQDAERLNDALTNQLYTDGDTQEAMIAIDAHYTLIGTAQP